MNAMPSAGNGFLHFSHSGFIRSGMVLFKQLAISKWQLAKTSTQLSLGHLFKEEIFVPVLANC